MAACCSPLEVRKIQRSFGIAMHSGGDCVGFDTSVLVGFFYLDVVGSDLSRNHSLTLEAQNYYIWRLCGVM